MEPTMQAIEDQSPKTTVQAIRHLYTITNMFGTPIEISYRMT